LPASLRLPALAAFITAVALPAAHASWSWGRGGKNVTARSGAGGTRSQKGLVADVEEALLGDGQPVGEEATGDPARELARGNDLARAGLNRDAAAAYLQAVRLEPSFAAAWNGLGSLLRQAGEWDLARKSFETAVELEPGNGLAHFNLATMLHREGHFQKADEHYVRALELEPGLWDPKVNPFIVGNSHASLALLKLHLKRPVSKAVLLDPGPASR
jgi:Flp pilus assembly protein TadD